MIKTARYEIIRGERILSHFDALRVDPMTTLKNAIAHTDRSEVDAAAELLRESGSHDEYLAAKTAFETALRLYQFRVKKYASENPIHFEPRLNEVIL